MPWKETTAMSQRRDFIEIAKQDGINFSALCREYKISRKTGYKWLRREQEGGAEGLVDRSRRPQNSPGKTKDTVEVAVLGVRDEYPAWGGRKIRRVLQDRGNEEIPAASTITEILRRHEKLDLHESIKHKACQHFEYEQPNELWQMDFKGFFTLEKGGYCHPLTVIDDHSRFLVGLKACPNQNGGTVQNQLTEIFEQYGLPERMLMDNGSCWGVDQGRRYTTFTRWLIRLGIMISHGRPYHPQTQGKDERLNRTLQDELISNCPMATLEESQEHFDLWRYTYNYIRPHEALQFDTPSTRYHPSQHQFPTILPPISYEPGDAIYKVGLSGGITFHSRRFYIGKAFCHQPVAVRPTLKDGVYHVYFCQQKVAQIKIREDNS